MEVTSFNSRGGEWSRPLKNEKSGQILPSLRISHSLLMGLGVSDFGSVSHIFAFLSSHCIFLSQTRILKRQSQ